MVPSRPWVGGAQKFTWYGWCGAGSPHCHRHRNVTPKNAKLWCNAWGQGTTPQADPCASIKSTYNSTAVSQLVAVGGSVQAPLNRGVIFSCRSPATPVLFIFKTSKTQGFPPRPTRVSLHFDTKQQAGLPGKSSSADSACISTAAPLKKARFSLQSKYVSSNTHHHHGTELTSWCTPRNLQIFWTYVEPLERLDSNSC